ncbi:hypothetical protein D6L41_07645 [Vibrio alginolyticus]|uniref:hypothetical protein n=1 Tax=Vibrio alginolyticus TaxID=663 RepID=UPI00215FB436|nr:hypothetical protein [Vibrio alginolyticus]EGR1561387.1 hypothetical protein [Vibrio alginolyticus]MCS0212403.1 hypothetical protein [Vibrio alginolyticus]
MLVQSAIHFALDYLIQNACRYFEVSISSNKVWGRNALAVILLAQNVMNKVDYKQTKTTKSKLDGFASNCLFSRSVVFFLTYS